jgi:hypothetical protein
MKIESGQELLDRADTVRMETSEMTYMVAICLANVVDRLDTIANLLQSGNVVQALAHDIDARHAG